MDNIFEIIRVSNKQHAMLYQISDLVIHPSFVEGGLRTYPQYEAASLNVPCLSQIGRHTKELNALYNNKLENVFCDFTNIKIALEKINILLNDE